MAIKGHQVEDVYSFDLSCTMATAGERGGVVCLTSTGNIGPDMDDSDRVVSYEASPSGKVVMGLLLHTVSDYDTTQVPENFQNPDVVPVNSKVTLIRRWQGMTNMITPSEVDSIGPSTAYLGNSGLLSKTSYLVGSSGDTRPVVGRFESAADADGFIKVTINIT
jgi:hypothetical protein